MFKHKDKSAYVWCVLAEYLHEPTHICLITRSEKKADQCVDRLLVQQRAKLPNVSPNNSYPKFSIHGMSEDFIYPLRHPHCAGIDL